MDFFQVSAMNADILFGYYNPSLVALSYIIAVFASYVALDMAGRLQSTHTRLASLGWLLSGAFAMGAGIWSMHFIGMLAFNLPVQIAYDPLLTIASMLVAILISGFALYLLMSRKRSWLRLIAGGILLGLGIAAMHYLGMAAMNKYVNIRYIPSLFVLSLIIAIIASEAALWLALKTNEPGIKRKTFYKVVSAFIMGLAICGMHYMGMHAAVFTDNFCATPISNSEIPLNSLAIYIAIVTFLIMGIMLILSSHNQSAQSAIQKEKEFLNGVLNNISDGIIACDAKGQLLFSNQAARKFYGAEQDINKIDISALPIKATLQGEHVQDVEIHLPSFEAAGRPRILLVDGQVILDEDGNKFGAVLALHDISEHKWMQEQLRLQSTHDALTGLPNRLLLIDRIEQALVQTKRSETLVAILFFDLDRFKIINDTLGHHIGDELLKAVSKNLRSITREQDTIARLGGDEFVMLMTDIVNEEAVIPIMQRIINIFKQLYIIKEHSLTVSSSIGISIYPKNGEDANTLLKNADAAMYRAKEYGRNNFQFYNEALNKRSLARLELERYLHQAIKENEFTLHYQPFIDLRTGLVVGAEALLRWRQPSLGMVPPLDFIPLAEETGLIVPIGEWVLRTACAQNKAWQIAGLPKIKVAVNLSGIQFKQNNLDKLIETILRQTRLSPEYLELELTESSIIDNAESIIKVLQNLKDLGIQLAIDDFGTGYSSLSYLKRFPIDKLKIDRSFTQDVTTDPDSAAIVLAVIAMANSLKLKVLAEGAENESQLGFLRMHRCDEIQGYYFSKPLPADEFAMFLRKNNEQAMQNKQPPT